MKNPSPSGTHPKSIYGDTAIRCLDIVLSLIALLLFLPVFIVVAVAIFADDPGPIFYRQQRIGQALKPFGIFKFRTMRVDKARPTGSIDPAKSLAEQRADFVTTETNDVRITRVGRVLRPIHLDEIPQLLNVLFGQMSMVGVRPDVAVQQADYRAEDWVKRHFFRPGITGVAQLDPKVNTMKKRTVQDLKWIDERNIILYFKCLFLTFTKVLKRNSL